MSYINIFSFNMHEFTNNQDFLAKFLCMGNTLCNQKTWIRPVEINIFKDFVVHSCQHKSYPSMIDCDYCWYAIR